MFPSQKNANRKSLKSQSNKFTDLLNNFMKAQVEEIPIDNLSTRDDIIAVMGPTGTGKSTFIEMATGVEGKAGHTLQSCTDKLCVIKLSLPGIIDSDVCFVDTPGFDNPRFSDTEIFMMISDWLNDTYKRHIHLVGLLYFHRITDNRMAGTPLKNLRMFEKLCGEKFNRIVLTTTMWDEVDKDLGEKREDELRKEYWKSMIDRGSSVQRFERNPRSAFNVLAPILDAVNRKNALLLQTEMTELGYRLNQTSAGKRFYSELDELVKNQQKCLERIRRELREDIHDPEYLETLLEDYKKISEQLRRAHDVFRKMKISVGDGLVSTSVFTNWHQFSIYSFKRKQTPSVAGVEEGDSEDDEELRETEGYMEQEKGKGDGPGVPYRVPYIPVTPQGDEGESARGRAPPQEQRIEATSTRQYKGQRRQDLPPAERERDSVLQREEEREPAQQRAMAEREAREKEFLQQQKWERENKEAREKEETLRLVDGVEREEEWARQHELARQQQELARQQQELIRQQQELSRQQQELSRQQQELIRQQQELTRQQQELARQ